MKFIRKLLRKQKKIWQGEELIWDMEFELKRQEDKLERMKSVVGRCDIEIEPLKDQIEKLAQSHKFEDREKRQELEKKLKEFEIKKANQIAFIEGDARKLGLKEIMERNKLKVVQVRDKIADTKEYY